MKLDEIRAMRAIASREAFLNAMKQVQAPGGNQGTLESVRPVWFALLTCVEKDLKHLWDSQYFKRWWKDNASLVSALIRLAPEQAKVDHNTPFPGGKL